MARVLWLAVLVCVVQCLPMSKDELEDFSNFLLKTSSLDLHVKSADPDHESDEEEVASDHAWEESGKFEGDLILNDRQRRLIVENVEGLSRNGLTDSTKRWPNNEVIYFIQKEHFNSGQVQAILAGIEDLERASCVKFRPYKKGDRDAVVIQGSRRGCFSQVGYQSGYQVLNLSGRHPVGRGCFRHGTVVHELLHSLGFYHMQSSPDRDDYIDVVWANIVQPARHNFRKYNSFSVSDFGVGYDYDSVLHYSRRAFSVNGQDTLVPKKRGAEIGQRVGLSDKDTQKLNKMYCDADNDAAVQADENTSKKTKTKKKKPKNQPFEGQGIGYHQGKTVVIKLPAVEIYKLPNIPSTRMFDFSRTPQIVSPQEESYRFGEEITFLYNPANSLNTETSRDTIKPSDEILNKNIEPHEVREEGLPKKKKDDHIAPYDLNESSKVISDYVPIDGYDKDLKDAYDRISNIVKENLYPHSKEYDHNFNKDYSKYHEPAKINHIYEPSLPKSPLTRLQKETDITHGPIVSFKTANDDSKSLFQDRMDIISLPTKKPYSSYEQTETPRYATLEYLKNRHDYSDVYSYSPNSAQKDFKIFAKSGRNNDDIKIKPYGLEFYTDYVSKDKDKIIHTPLQQNVSKQVKPEKYKLEDRPKYEQFDSLHALLPTKKPYSAFDHTETPEYASLKYLKNRHDISDDYQLKKLDHEKIDRRKSYKTLVEDRLDEEDWYKKNANRHKPANHDRDLYSDYAQNVQGSEDNLSDEYNDSDDEENSRDSLRNTNAEYNIEKKDQHDPDIEREDKYLTSHAEFENLKDASSTVPEKSKRNRDHSYDSYGRKQKEKIFDHSTEALHDNDSNNEELPSNIPVYIKDIISDHETRAFAKSIKQSSNKNSKESPERSQAYTQYGIPVPLSNGWFKVTYTIP